MLLQFTSMKSLAVDALPIISSDLTERLPEGACTFPRLFSDIVRGAIGDTGTLSFGKKNVHRRAAVPSDQAAQYYASYVTCQVASKESASFVPVYAPLLLMPKRDLKLKRDFKLKNG